MRFLANENFPLDSIYLLRQMGYDVAAIILDSPAAKDPEVLSRAVKEERIVLTFDKDYGELIFRLRLPAPIGVVLFRYNPLTPMEPAEHLISLLKFKSFSLEDKFTVIERDQIRQRPLLKQNRN